MDDFVRLPIGDYGATFDRFDICYAWQALENDYNVGGWLQDRPSNQRRKESCGVQLTRMDFRPGIGGGTFSALDDNQKAIYVTAAARLQLPADEEILAWVNGPADPSAGTIQDPDDTDAAMPKIEPPAIRKRSPTPDEVKRARMVAGQNQTDAAATIFCHINAWHQWEKGLREMHPSMFRDYLRETKQKVAIGEGWFVD